MAEKITKKYGFEVGKVYRTSMPCYDEIGNPYEPGTELKIISITPKVRIITGYRSKDNKPYFYNAELADGSSSARIRENFVTLIKEK